MRRVCLTSGLSKRPANTLRPFRRLATMATALAPRGTWMNDLAWLVGRRLSGALPRAHVWPVSFGRRASPVAERLWRLLEGGRTRITSQDHGPKFGLPTPFQADAELDKRITGSTVRSVRRGKGTLDLAVEFES